MIIKEKELNKFTFRKIRYGKCEWIIDWPRDPDGRQDWQAAIKELATRAGHTVQLDNHGTALVRDYQGQERSISPSTHVGDWRAAFLLYVDDIIQGRLISPTVEAIFPSIEAAPVPPGLRDGFTPAELCDVKANKSKPFLRPLRDFSRSELLRLDVGDGPAKNNGSLRGHTTDLALIECACGRLLVGHKSIIDGSGNAWTSCGCNDWSCKHLGYSGDRRDTLKAAWREWCTMHLIKTTPQAALHQCLEFKGYNMDCSLPHFEDFWTWYFKEAKRTKQTYIQRIDPTKPFTMDNLSLPEKRWTVDDPANGQRFKLGI